MKLLKLFIFLMLYVQLSILANNRLDTEYIQNIKEEYRVILDKLFLQGREKLSVKEDIVVWLYDKNKEELKDVQNFMSDVKVAVDFDRSDENIIKKELEGYLKEKIRDEAQKVLDADGTTAENMQDFFHISRIICSVTLESDNPCRNMTQAFKKEYRFAMKELSVLDKAREKIKKIDKKRTKQELLHQLREQIILGTSPRK